ncbi:MAG TPA: DUF1848 domain-containing protein [Lachnospiraceae bacterium]|nr:DUF1848 domain-containing protein [Lachnospiraceae bacterium]
MILSVSRRTDIPNYYSDWFYERVKAGHLYVRNPFNFHQVSRIDITPEVVDCIVFWSKNPRNMMKRLDELDQFQYYIQFTLTGYGIDIEPNLPSKREVLIPAFQELSEKIGKEKMIWRYDPILINNRYTLEYHRKAFQEIAKSLNGCTQKVVISFIDFYAKTRKNMQILGIDEIDDQTKLSLARSLSEIAKENGMTIESCAEQIDLTTAGIMHGSCIDRDMIERIVGCPIKCSKDRNQRAECGCVESIDIGFYDTCMNGCKYCYANRNDRKVMENSKKYNADSPILCGEITNEDTISTRKVESFMKL